MFNKTQLNQLYQYSYSLTNNPDNAYDLLQTGLEKYLKQANTNIEYKIAYVRQIIRNQFIDDQRRIQRIIFDSLETDKLHTTLAIDTSSLEQIVISEQQVAIIWKILTVSEREILYLWAVEGYSAKQISEEINIPRGTILSKIHRLKHKVNKEFETDKFLGVDL